MPKVWNFNPNGVNVIIYDSVTRLIEKRRNALMSFLKTGDLTKAKEYCEHYRVPVPKDPDQFREHVERAAECMEARIIHEAKRVVKKKARRTRRRKYSKEQVQKLVDQGLNGPQIAKELGCSTNTIYNLVREYNIEYKRAKAGRKKGSTSWTVIDKDELQRLCDKGISIDKIAEEMGVGVGIVTRNIREQGIKRKDLRKERKINKDILKRMIQEDMTNEQIAKALSCHTSTVTKAVRKYGLWRRKREKNNL